MRNAQDKMMLEDDQKERISLLIEHRLPWLLLGLIGGIVATIFSSQFEMLLSENIQLAFFIPVIVYMADAVGTQTETVFVRNLAREKVQFHIYLFKELLLGIVLGGFFGFIAGLFSYFWFHQFQQSFVIGLSMFLTMATAPAVALVVPSIIQKEHKDPAVGAGPFTTVIQDLLSLIIYFTIATLIILR